MMDGTWHDEVAVAPSWDGPWEIIWSTDMVMIPCGESVRDRATAMYLLKVGLRLDEVIR